MISIPEAKRLARHLSAERLLSHGHALDAVARAAGFRDWNTFSASADSGARHSPDHGGPATDPVARQQVVPILRVFDHQLARDFYCGFLGFTWQWQHQFEPDLPVYAQVERKGSVLHLSEHHGDATPGGAVMVAIDDIDRYQAELIAQRHRGARPGIEDNAWGRTMEVTDPFGNRITFWQR